MQNFKQKSSKCWILIFGQVLDFFKDFMKESDT